MLGYGYKPTHFGSTEFQEVIIWKKILSVIPFLGEGDLKFMLCMELGKNRELVKIENIYQTHLYVVTVENVCVSKTEFCAMQTETKNLLHSFSID
jgi:hypothetical protein